MAFLGERNKLNFVVQLPSRVGVGGLYAVSLALEQTEKGKQIVWKHMPLNPKMQDFTDLSQAVDMVLVGSELSAVEDIWLSYFGSEADGATARWQDRWESDVRLPSLIRVQVRFASGSEWPDFVVAPMLTSELAR